MKRLTVSPGVRIDTFNAESQSGCREAGRFVPAFCRDKVNVHGPRTSFREIVQAGEGLHICITDAADRADTHCDCHIDEIQQGQVCFDGFCVPLLNKQTVEHVKKVGPWLREEAKKTVVDWTKKHSPFNF